MLPLAGGDCTVEVEGRRFELAGPRERVRARERLGVRPDRRRAAPVLGGGLRARARLGARDAALRPGLRRGRRRAGRAARRRPVDAAAQQLHGAGGVRRGRQADLLRGADARRQLVELPAAQARRHARVRGRQRGDLLLPRGSHRHDRLLARGLRRAPHVHGRPLDRRDRDRARRRRLPRAGRLPRPVHRGARLPALLPQRDGLRRRPAQARIRRRRAVSLDPCRPGTAWISTPAFP